MSVYRPLPLTVDGLAETGRSLIAVPSPGEAISTFHSCVHGDVCPQQARDGATQLGGQGEVLGNSPMSPSWVAPSRACCGQTSPWTQEWKVEMASPGDGTAIRDRPVSGKSQSAVKGRDGKRSLVRIHVRSGAAIVLMLLSAMACFIAGIFLPLYFRDEAVAVSKSNFSVSRVDHSLAGR